MKKVRWLRFKSELSSEQVMAGLDTLKFSSQDADGFQVVRFREDIVEARFIEKLEYDESVKDPFGVETISRHVTYRQQDFSIHSRHGTLEITNPSRSLTPLLTRLGEACSFDCYIEPIYIDLGLVKAKFIYANDCFTNKSTTVSDLDLGDGVVARVVASGIGSANKVLSDIVKSRPHKLNTIAYSSNTTEIRASYSISRDAALRVSGRDGGKIIDAFRIFLYDSLI